MNDYKELIEILRDDEYCGRLDFVYDAADAIEKLVKDRNVLQLQNHLERCEHEHTRKERDAAVADLTNIVHDMANTCICDYCVGCGKDRHHDECKTDEGDSWQWRGVQEANDDE